MRPRKTVLLVGEDQERMGTIRFLLDLHHFAAMPCARADEALKLLLERHYDLVIVDWPLEGAALLFESARAIDKQTGLLMLAYGLDLPPFDCIADFVLCKGQRSSELLLEAAKRLAVRKRGPVKGKKPVASVRAAAELKKII